VRIEEEQWIALMDDLAENDYTIAD